MAGIEAPALLAFGAGIIGTVSAFAAKYLFDYRFSVRRLELDERASLATTLGSRPGQLRRAAQRLDSRIESFDRDAQHLSLWLRPVERAVDDGYFLKSSVQRIFTFVTFGSLLEQAMDVLPYETMRARRDLQDQYSLLHLATDALTNIEMVEDFPGYPKDRAAFQLFTGTLDEVADLGVGIYNRNSQVVPSSEFASAYGSGERSLMQLREWVSAAREIDSRGTVIRARMFTLSAIVGCYLRSDPPTFTNDGVLAARLASLSALESANGYDFASRIPGWLDAQGQTARERWATR